MIAAYVQTTVVQTDWTLVTALLSANAALGVVVGILWWRYNQARDKYDALLIRDRDELVPEMVRMGQLLTTHSANATKLLEESIKLRSYRRRGESGDASA